uniref:Uncharacterized protein n=1 Tax=Siphoviridae sp. cttqT1 TaxID=2827961 RepID=A0A8S5TP62_9CAUD|nr:MAG TPA: hypothetical protein [Siphoviridae sp. cttqT1]DAU16337.1 MAG TPA: hypothetical protein [Caudoviricetes sp.]
MYFAFITIICKRNRNVSASKLYVKLMSIIRQFLELLMHKLISTIQ